MKKLLRSIWHWLKKYLSDRASKKSRDETIKKMKKLYGLKKLSSEQKKQIQDYWKPLTGHKVSTKWHQLLYSLSGEFKPEYEPYEVCHEVQNKLSFRYQNNWAFDDKNLYRQLLKGFNIPERVAECFHGVYYLPQVSDTEVPFEEFVSHLKNLDDCIIKPSAYSSGGSGVSTLSVSGGIVKASGSPIEQFILSYQKAHRDSFCIEKKISECENLRALNPSSCNTIRVHTWRDRKNERIKFVSAFIRVGRKNSIVDNGALGGICIGISYTNKRGGGIVQRCDNKPLFRC